MLKILPSRILAAATLVAAGWAALAADNAPSATVNPAPADTKKDSALAKPLEMDGGYALVGFDRLAAFNYIPPDYGPDGKAVPANKGADQIPPEIRAFDQRKVAVTGYMIPIKMEDKLVKEFMLITSPMLCCYGVMPRVNEWVTVKMVAKGVPFTQDVPLTLYGKLRVGETFENGYLLGIYQLEGERMAVK